MELYGQFMDCISRLVGFEIKHKLWNKGGDFRKFCQENEIENKMFLYKEERFGCFSNIKLV